MDTLDALARCRSIAPPPAGSEVERDALARFTDLFADFRAERIARLLDDVYAEQVHFDDTLKTVRGREALRHYLLDSAAAVEQCRIDVLDVSRNQAGEHLLRWKMLIRFRRLQRGVDHWSSGISHLRFDGDGRVVYQQDYWNNADHLYQHIPLLGTLIRLVKRRL